MSGLDLKSVLFYLPSEVAMMFRKLDDTTGEPDAEWAVRAGRRGFLKTAVRHFGRKQTLFLKTEVDRIVADGAPGAPRRYRKHVDVNTEKSYNGTIPESPGTEEPAAGGGTDAETR